jgi:hypothetical protein
MRRAISFVCALALVVGGLYWLGIIISGWLPDGYQGPPVRGKVMGIIVAVPVVMIALGATWLLEDYAPQWLPQWWHRPRFPRHRSGPRSDFTVDSKGKARRDRP